ncbi:heme ABC transporter ATP-binding protein [Spirochaetia bacterium]|nr:heme ABC transporter ATP-binding protein [Spirochaetia bacterium]
MEYDYAVQMKGITKIYPGNNRRAVSGVSLDLRKGEILCLAGENGAGKSTLMKVLYGLIPPTAGEILVRGKPASITSPLDANRAGIGMVHQHFMLFPEFTVAQNVVMGIEPLKGKVFYDTAEAEDRVTEEILRHQFSIEADKTVKDLTVGQMQQVEILKLLYRKLDILILDEPTAVLTEQEITSLFRTFRELSGTGKSLILITHKMPEIKRVSDRVAVMRRGEMAGVYNTADIDEQTIARLMIGRSQLTQRIERKASAAGPGVPVITFENVTAARRGQNRPLLNGVSFTAHAGEILGLAGVGGNGLETVEAALGGLVPVTSGRILHRGEDISALDTEALRKRGLAYVPADRLHTGSAPEASVRENIIIHKRREFSHAGFLDRKRMAGFSQELLAEYGIAGDDERRLGALSGGNIQKLILAREIRQYRDYIVFSEPARGLDIAASRYVYQEMAALQARGAAVILISSNLDEILANANRILVFYQGAIAAEIRDVANRGSGELSDELKEEIGAYMLGLHIQETAYG